MSRKINLTQPVLNLDGTEARTIIKSEELCSLCRQNLLISDKPFTLKMALVRCLVNKLIDPKTQREIIRTGQQIYDASRLAWKIDDMDEITLDAKQIVDLKERAYLALTPVAMMRVWDILEPREE